MIRTLPPKTRFIESAKAGKISPVYAELPFMPPQQIFECIASPYSFILESIKGPEKIARYSFIGTEPFLIFKVKNGVIEVGDRRKGPGFRGLSFQSSIAPLKILKEILSAYRVELSEDLPPFVGGAVGLISYDFVHYFENIPGNAVDDLDIPDAHFIFVDTVIAVDHKFQKTFLISCPVRDAGAGVGFKATLAEWENAYEKACERILAIHENVIARSKATKQSHFLEIASPSALNDRTCTNTPIHIRHEMGKEAYMDIVRKAKEYIRAGDIFQANLSQRVSAHIGAVEPWQIYQTLSRINPSPFACYLNFGNYCIASSSPERLVRVSGRTVETRPIAGTRPRGKDAESDLKMRNDLLLNEKERAEHLMLIDLERNDLGKISEYSTVEVDEFMITEDYSHVIHIVSNIKGILAKGRDCFDAIRATFPGGTITGVPKVRCMEIIDELEPVTRGPYTGSIGYISFTGDMDLNIIIRTFVIKDNTAYVQAGAGIVADSDPEREYYETLKKAEALIRTLESLR